MYSEGKPGSYIHMGSSEREDQLLSAQVLHTQSRRLHVHRHKLSGTRQQNVHRQIYRSVLIKTLSDTLPSGSVSLNLCLKFDLVFFTSVHTERVFSFHYATCNARLTVLVSL